MSDIETHVENVKASVDAELAKQPFRAEPTWADLHTAIAAVVRYFFGGAATLPPTPVAVNADAVTPDVVADTPAPIYQDDPATDADDEISVACPVDRADVAAEPPAAVNDEPPPPPTAA